MKSRQGACRDLRTDMVNTFDGSPISAFAYAYDAAGRRTERVDSGLTTNLFGYNMKSELADAIMGTNIYAYLYDPIGNRQLASVNEVTNLYQANELNQYTNINAGVVEPIYDPDGNMTLFGLWTYAWDAENRLISVSSNGVPVVQNQYDYMSRRVMKATATQTNTFLYDGWNLVREDLGAATPSSRSYVWGLDLSQSLQGAGGVGGLLAMLSPDSCHLTPAYDANGNITDLVDTNGSVVAHYEYDPYGNTIAKSGDQADANPFRFSSKYWDGETGFYYYGYRFYSPGLGRWLNRDPIEENGGVNLYCILINDTINWYDILGLSKFPQPPIFDPPGGPGPELPGWKVIIVGLMSPVMDNIVNQLTDYMDKCDPCDGYSKCSFCCNSATIAALAAATAAAAAGHTACVGVGKGRPWITAACWAFVYNLHDKTSDRILDAQTACLTKCVQ